MPKLITIVLLAACMSGCAIGGQVIILFAEKDSAIGETAVTIDDGGTDLPGILYRSPVDVGELDVGDIDKSRRKATTQPK